MPPIGIPEDDLPKNGPQLWMIIVFIVLLIGFTTVATVLVMNGIGKKACAESKSAAVGAAGGGGEGAAAREVVDPREFIASFEANLGKIKQVDNNLFTAARTETALDVKTEGGMELRTYVMWDRMEGMDPNTLWATLSLMKINEGKDPVVTRIGMLMHATEMIVVDGVSIMFDPVSETEALFTLDTTQYWADQHPGAAKQ